MGKSNENKETRLYPEYEQPIDVDFIMSVGWDKDKAEYIYETLVAMEIAGNGYFYDDICDIVSESDTEEYVGIYDESYFDQYLYEVAGCDFEDMIPGVYNPENGFYRTKDGEYLIEIQL